MSMTQPQKKYFCNRIDEIATLKTKVLIKPQEKSKAIVFKEGLDSGIIKLKDSVEFRQTIERHLRNSKTTSVYNYPYMYDISLKKLSNGFEHALRKEQEQYDALMFIYNTEVEEIKEESTKIKDEAMFGDEKEAHDLLKKFQEK
jgi:hypothetical protein